MQEVDGYGQFCPVAMAAEVICARWTPLILRELLCGSTRFNDLRRGVPRMSPALLVKRLRDLEEAGIVRRVASRTEPGILEYELTPAGRDLKPVIEAIGIWGQRWVESELSLQHLATHDALTGLPNRTFLHDRALRLLPGQHAHPERHEPGWH